MILSELKLQLPQLDGLRFRLPDGKRVPRHFHVTEVGLVRKSFMDCGGTLREATTVSLQLWYSSDLHHRLQADKLLRILEQATDTLGLPDATIEVEYQGPTLQRYGLSITDGELHLTTLHTACLASDSCGVPQMLQVAASQCCTPGSNCC